MAVATIQKIESLQEHPNADTLLIATVLGYQVVVKKGEFSTGDKIVYIEVDSVVEDRPEYEFLRNKDFRIKTIRLRQVYSQGLCIPLTALNHIPEIAADLTIDRDVSDLVGAKHYEKPLPEELVGQAVGNTLPLGMSKTDSKRLQTHLRVLSEFQGKAMWAAQKCDGTSTTYAYKLGNIHVCGRAVEWTEAPGNKYWEMFRKLNLEEKLRAYGKNIAVRGELCGPGIQQNPMGLTEIHFFCYDILDLDTNEYYSLEDRNKVIELFELETPIIVGTWENFNLTQADLEQLAEDQRYPNGKQGEGIVVRPVVEAYSHALNGRLACKVISKKYEL